MRVQHRILHHLLVRRQADHAAITVRVLHAPHEAHRLLGHGDRCLSGSGFGRGGGMLFRLRAAVVIHGIGIDRRIQRPGGIEMGGVDLDPAGRRALAGECRATQVRDVGDLLAAGQPVRDLDDLSLAVAVDEQVRLGIEQHRAAHFLGPVVEMRDAAQRGFDAADHDRDFAIGLTGALRIHDDGSIGPLAALAARRVGVIAADASIAGVAVHHRIHVAGCDAEIEIRSAERTEGVRTVPIRLGDDADTEPLRLEHTTDDGHAEAGVIDVGIAGDDDHVAAVPAERLHFGAAGRQERRCSEARGPVRAVSGDVRGILHGGRIRPRKSGRSRRGGRLCPREQGGHGC